MTFLYPLGLLGLIGIPILILVYIIKNRYTEQTIPSTYMWILSERFLKRRNPISKITGIISLILQLLLVLVLSFSVAHPVITLPGAAHEYCFILDASASMSMQSDGVTRFARAKNEIMNVVDDAKDGSVFSVIVVGETTEVIVELSDDRERISELVASAECSDSAIEYTDALGIAQRYFDDNSSALVYLVTDTAYNEHENIELVNVARDEANFSVEDLTYVILDEKNVMVTGRVVSYNGEGLVDVDIFSDVSELPIGSTKVQLFKDTAESFSLSVPLEDFYSITAKVTVADSMSVDNSATVYNIKSENAYNALLVSDTPFFLEAVLASVSNADLTVMSVEEYTAYKNRLAKQGREVSGYGLYVYDAYNPVTMPKDGAVWLIGVNGSVENSGFSVQSEVTVEEEAARLELTTSSSGIARKLTAGMAKNDISVHKYIKCGLYGDFTTIYSYMGNPIVFTGLNTYGNREVVFAFNLHDSNVALSVDYLILLDNLIEYSFPEVIETTEYYCGDTAEINVVSGCTSIRVVSPSGEVIYTDVSRAISEFVLTEVGEYKIVVEISGAEREFYLYSSVPKEERRVFATVEEMNLQGESNDEGRDGRFDNLTALFIIAALLFTAEWVVYCYDKYQLR